MFSIGRDTTEGYDFNSEDNKKKWHGLFIPSLNMIQKTTHPDLIVNNEGLKHVESLILRLLGSLISFPSNSVGTLHISDVEERIKRLFQRPLDIGSIRKAHETLSALKYHKKSKANSRYCASERVSLKTPVDKFHQLLQKELGFKIDIQVSTFILAILEYIATDILQLSGHFVRKIFSGKPISNTEITSQDIRIAMYADKALMDTFYKDVDEVEGPPPSASFHCHHSPFDWDINDSEYGNIFNRTSMTYSEAVKELIHEERQFIRDLNLIIKVFRDPLLRILPPKDLEKIFANINDIYDFSNNFLGSLEDAVEVADVENCPAIGGCFEETAECLEFDVFEKYATEVMSLSCRRHLYSVLSIPNIAKTISSLGNEMLAAFRYVLPRLLLVPVYHCFSYFKAIENLKERTPSREDKESFVQAEGLLTTLKNQLESITKRNKFGELYLLRLYGRVNRATAMARMTDIQRSIDNWDGKDIWQSCNEFIMEGPLQKVSSFQSRSAKFTDRHAFLFDGLLVLCKANTKRSAGNGRDSTSEWRLKERFLIRNIEISECTDFCDRNSNFYLPASPSFNSGDEMSPDFHTTDQSFTLLNNISTSMTNSSMNVSSSANNETVGSNGLSSHLANAFQISLRNQNPVILVAKTAEDKDVWMSQLILLNTRSMLERALDSCLQEEAKKHPLQLPHPSMYRFAIEDMDTNIVFEENRSNPNVPLVKGATLLKLIERLTYHKYGDPMFVRTFLTTYRTFCSPSLLLDFLIERFEIPEPDFRSCMLAVHYANDELASPTSIHPPVDAEQSDSNTGPTSPTSPTHSMSLSATPSDFNALFDELDEQCQKDYKEMLKRFRKEYVQPVQFRVLNVLRHWIDNHYYDFERDNQLLQKLTDFLDEKVATCRNMRKWCEHLKKVLKRKKLENQEATREVVLSFDSSPPPIEWWLARPGDVEDFDLLTLHPVEIARQLTLLEFDLYRAVKPSELIGPKSQTAIWTQKDKQKTSPNLLRIMRHNSNFTFYLERCIVNAENFEERTAIVARIIEIMMVLQELNNFNGVIEVISALDSAPIHRLEHTRTSIERNSKFKKALEEAQELFDCHFKKYKEKLRSINPPCVPFFGIYLTNIVHIEEGNQEYLSPLDTASVCESSNLTLGDAATEKLINFNKKRRVAEITVLIQQYQNQPYCLTVEHSIRSFLENLNPRGDMDEEEFSRMLFNKSLEIEPRGSKQATRYPRRWPDRSLKSPLKNRNIFFTPFEPISNLANSLTSSVANNHSNTHSGHHNNFSSQTNLHDPDTVSLQQQQSPSTPLTPSAFHGTQAVNDPVFAPVIIGAGNMTPALSPTAHSTTFNFPPMSNIQTLPPTPTPSSSSFVPHPNKFPLKPPPLPPRTNRMNAHSQQSPRSRIHPTLPSAGGSDEEASASPTSSSPPPLPPRSSTMTRSLSMQTCRDPQLQAPPLPPFPHPQHHASSPHQFVHQRVNSDIILSGNNSSNGAPMVRRNSTLELLPPRRFSHGGAAPSSLPPVPNSPTSPGIFCNVPPLPPPLPAQSSPPPSTPSATHPPPPPIPPSPPSATTSHPLPPPPPGSTSPVPELPPKTYRLSNVCR